MADEDLAIAPTEQAPPAIEPEQSLEAPKDEPELIPEPGEETEIEEPEAPTIDVVEIEWDDGQKYQIPKALEGGLLRNKDYTQKTQTVAEKAKALESREAEITRKLEATDEELQAKAQLITMDERLEAYGKLTQADWDAAYQTDYPGTDRAWRDYLLLKEKRGEVAKTLETRQTERTQKAEQDLANRVEETKAFAQKEIPGWKPELTETLVKFALGEGVPEALIKANWSPTFYKLLHKAHIGSLALQRQTAVPKPAPVPPQPLQTVGGKSTPAARTDLASASMEDYIAARKKGVGGKPLR